MDRSFANVQYAFCVSDTSTIVGLLLNVVRAQFETLLLFVQLITAPHEVLVMRQLSSNTIDTLIKLLTMHYK